MDKKYLMNGLAALAIVAGISSCVKDVDGVNTADQEKAAKENAELQLGLTIPEGQTWEMSQQIAANVTVDLNAEETYTVGICDKNPLNFADAKYYALKKAEGGKISATFTAPIAKSDYYVIAYNSKYQAIVNKVEASNGVIDANITNKATAASRTMRAANVSGVTFDYYDFPEDASAGKFLADVPEGVEKLTQNAASVNGWIDESWTNDINAWGNNINGKTTGGTLYIKGNCDFSNRSFYFAGNSELYIVKGATLTLAENNGAGNLQANTKIYIAEGAKLVAKGELKLNNGLHIYNHGTIEAPKLSTNSNSLLYNVGTVTVQNKISVENDLSVIVNDGTITAADLNTAGSGKFQNNGNATITGTTFVNSNNNTWVNEGQYHTGNFIYNAASNEVINNCRLIVDEDFNINLGDNPGDGCFKMNSGASVTTKNFNGGGNWAKNYSTGWSSFNGGPFYIFMGSGSLFEVTETATMNATKADYGIYNVSNNGWAVFKAKNIVAGAAGQGYEVTYGGNLAVVCDTHFENGKSGSYPYIDFDGNATIYNAGKVAPKITKIPATKCNPGFEPGEGTEIDVNPDIKTYAFEDQIINGDYDMNDVVLQMSYVPERDSQGNITINEKKLDVKLVAAGATFNIKVFIGEEPLFGGKEIHAAFAEANPGMNIVAGKMVNTGAKANFNGAKPATCQIEFPNAVDFKNLDVKIVVNDKTDSPIEYLGDKEKVTPYAIMIPNNWRWPQERTIITEAYPGKKIAGSDEYDENFSFKKWAETTGSNRDNIDWYNNPVEGKTFSIAGNATNN